MLDLNFILEFYFIKTPGQITFFRRQERPNFNVFCHCKYLVFVKWPPSVACRASTQVIRVRSPVPAKSWWSVTVSHSLTTPRCKIGTSPMWEDRSSASPVWDVEQPLISLPWGDGTLGRILTPRLGEFSDVFLAGELGYCELQQMSLLVSRR